MRDTGIVHTVTFGKGELVNGRQRQATGAKAEKMDTDVRKISVDIK
jgi:hypothetical protein